MSVVGEISEEIISSVKSVFNWVINIDSFKDKLVNEYVISPTFSTHDGNLKKNDWQLELFPKGKNEENYMNVYLKHLNENDTYIKFSVSILNENDMIVHSKSTFRDFFAKKVQAWGWDTYVAQSFVTDPKNKILGDKQLRIMCKIVHEKKDNTTKSGEQNFNVLTHFSKFQELLTNQEFSDVTIIAEKKQFYLHKCILTLYSPVFKAMFSHNMKEKNQGMVEIEDIKYNVLEGLFQFIYTGKVNEIESKVCDLLIASEKYDINGLKALCEDTMIKNLSENNVIEYLTIAVSNNAEKLKSNSMRFVSQHLEDLVKKTEFDEFDTQHPKLLLEIIKNYHCA